MKNLDYNIKTGISFLIFIFLGGLFAFAYASPSLAPVKPDFQDYIQNQQNVKARKQKRKRHSLGLVPAPFDRSHMKGQKVVKQVTAVQGLAGPVVGQSPYPASYDLRSQGKLTVVKDQGQYNTCWSFATYGSMESCLLPAQTWDFSEKNLVNLTGYDLGESGGGNYLMSTAYLARWIGPVNESDDHYPSDAAGWSSSSSGLPVQKHIQEALFLPDRSSSTDNDNIKGMVTSYGAVMTSMYMDEDTSDGYLNLNTTSYYFNGSTTTTTNHAVAIVGWNDNYPASNFSITPPGNGAFIIRNSWGTDWGDGGYFYISYYDSDIATDLTVFDDAESTGNHHNVYQYDPLGMTTSLGYSSNTAWFANIFTASANEELNAIGFYALSVNTSYTINIYSGFNGASFTGLLASQNRYNACSRIPHDSTEFPASYYSRSKILYRCRSNNSGL